jgi:hypothetical protein
VTTDSGPLLLLRAGGSAASGGVTPLPPIAGRLRVNGRFFQNDLGDYRAVWTGALAGLSLADPRPYLTWAAQQGFGGVRVFAGDLGWAGQTIASALANLPRFMTIAEELRLYVEVTALTGTNLGYSVEDHLTSINQILAPFDNAVVEIANEPYHDTQSEAVHDPAYLLEVSKLIDPSIITALGAAYEDESLEMSGGDYVTAHLDRGRDDWNMVRRVRELENVSATTGKHVLNNEPKKAGSQLADATIVFTMAVLNRGFEVGGVFHSDSALDAVVPDAAQQAYADAYMAGSRVITTTERLRFQNAGWTTSPVKSAHFTENTTPVPDPQGLIRAYSFVSNSQSVLVEVGAGANTNVVLQNGYTFGPQLVDRKANDHRSCRITTLFNPGTTTTTGATYRRRRGL